MKLAKNNLSGLSQQAASVVDGESTCQSVHRWPVELMIRVRKIDCMLADIQAHIQTLRREQIYLGLVRVELIGKEARLTMV